MPSSVQSPITELYTAYKRATSQQSGMLNQLKQKVRAIVAQKQLVSWMNDTKWLELQHAVRALPFPPPYIVRCVTDEDLISDNALNTPPSWFGDWSNYYDEGMPVLFTIEWMKVRPQLSKHRGCLIEAEVVDASEAFRAILYQLHIPFDEQDHIFTLYGYKTR